MALNLKKEGLLIIDFMNVNKTISNLVSIEEKKINDILFNITRSVKESIYKKKLLLSIMIKIIIFRKGNGFYTF